MGEIETLPQSVAKKRGQRTRPALRVVTPEVEARLEQARASLAHAAANDRLAAAIETHNAHAATALEAVACVGDRMDAAGTWLKRAAKIVFWVGPPVATLALSLPPTVAEGLGELFSAIARLIE
jgi:hypothetical protein